MAGSAVRFCVQTVKTIHHDAPRFIYPAGQSRIIERAPVINHKDEELILLESLSDACRRS